MPAEAKQLSPSQLLLRQTRAYRRGYYTALRGEPIPADIGAAIEKRREDFLDGYALGREKCATQR